jgi:ribosomal protein S18 acetylase RimI-like enzyme
MDTKLKNKLIEYNFNNISKLRIKYSELRNATSSPSSLGWILIDPFDKLIGYIHVYADYILGLYITPEFRKRGYGSELIKRITKENKFGGLSVNFMKDNEIAHKFFLKHGFHDNQLLNGRVLEMTTYNN